jgi:hypothetical protein
MKPGTATRRRRLFAALIAVGLSGAAVVMLAEPSQCKLPVTLPQALGLAQAAQGALPIPGPSRANTAGR